MPLSNKSLTRNRFLAMTLVEVVMALAVLSILLVVAFGSLSSISRSKKSLDDYQDVYLVAQSLLRRLTRELQLATCADLDCTKGKGILPPPDDTASKPGPFLLAEKGGAGSNSSITFLAMEAGQYLPDSGTRSGRVQITYRLGKEDRSDDLFTFVRDEVPYITPAAEAYKKRITFPITKNVVSFDFAFYDRDADNWSEDWGTKPGSVSSLPALIKFSLVLRSAGGIDLPFETIVPVRTALHN